ncbi:MAG TPA: hypothetical protein VHF50_05490 [Solirubrobacterales bacterium]|nr:hypothetical protein [Solirubrobacterales bacterium]
MDSKVGRVSLGLVVVAAAVVLFVVLRGDDGKSPYEQMEEERLEKTAPRNDGADDGSRAEGRPSPAVPTIVVRAGKPVGGVRELDFDAGGTVRFAVRSNTVDELHIHGYDVERQLPAGRTVRVEFPASIEGIFEAELHGSGEQIAELRINP